jgi:hypothetical protein
MTGQTRDETARNAQRRILGQYRRRPAEYCGEICPAPNGGFQIVITTNDAVAACLVAVTCEGGERLHNHPPDPVRLTDADEAITPERPAGQIFEPRRGYSPEDGPGYLIIGPTLYYRDAAGNVREVE